MRTVKVENFGPIKSANVELGNLTILIGAQATGKSLFLELLKLMADKRHIVSTLKKYNYVIEGNPANLLNLYFGEGMSGAWTDETKVFIDKQEATIETNLPEAESEKIFYIPAQRILSISDGRPKNFMEFDLSTPYVLRHFSETLRMFMPRLEQHIPLGHSIFHGGTVYVDTRTGQRKMRMKIDGMDIPFMTWSAGQKESTPLLMGIANLWNTPQTPIGKDTYKYVVVEEPEMGLHPQAIKFVLFQLLDLIYLGYQIILSTHSPSFLEFAWSIRRLQESEAPIEKRQQALEELFSETESPHKRFIAQTILGKQIKTHYFKHKEDGKVYSEDISSLDVFNDNVDISEWGGLSEFATKTSELVSRFSNE
ncbi:MAG: ATP-binding protein [Mediterranea sp.]|jgi:AAA15 family ATPase/GTPase|nr:ATP-binding protein [Mediterranea sp.]